MRRIPGLVVAGLLGLFASSALVAAQAGRTFVVTMTGAEEAPTPGDTDGTGQAVITVNPGTGEIHYELTATGIAPATAAHIHRGVAGKAGPVVVPLDPPTNGSSSGTASVTRDLALEIIREPSDFYVNVHNAEFPDGAIRGQLGNVRGGPPD